MSQLDAAVPEVEGPYPLATLRHSVAHLMASAVGKLFPGVRYGFGPAIEHGFYYDFDLPEPLTEKDLRRIEKEMRRIARARTSGARRSPASRPGGVWTRPVRPTRSRPWT